ncbi:MAG: dual specificity protein phosphatase [Patescibacteria group bacterium]|jgi:protein-tyrosine phosphatase
MKPDEQPVTLEFSKITDNIYIGSNACCQIRFAEPLLKEGITADLSLEEDHVDMPFGVSFYLWLPVPDMLPPTIDQLEVGVAYMTKVIELGHKVLVHCRWGHGRGPTMVAAYLVRTGMSVDAAIQLMTEKRPVVHIEVEQVAALRQFALRKV